MKAVTTLLIAGLFFTFAAETNASSLFPEEFGQSLISTAMENVQATNTPPLALANPAKFHVTSLAATAITGDNENIGFQRQQGRISGARQYLEVAPFTAYTFGGRLEDEETDEKVKIKDSSSYGLRLAYDYQLYSQIEFLWSHQETELSDNGPLPEDTMFDMNVDYFHFGGTLVWDQGKLEPFFSGSIGLTRFDPETSNLDTETRFSMGFGGGVRYFPTERLGMYLGARGFLTFFNSEWEVKSDSTGTTARYEADTLWQFQVYSGLVLVF